MAKYSNELIQLFSNLNLQHIGFLAKNLTIDQIKILHTKVLPKLPLERRQEVQELLIENEKKLYARFGEEEVVNAALSEQHSVSNRLKDVFDSFTREIIAGLKNEEVRKQFFQKASEDELFILEKKLKDIRLGDYEEAILLGLIEERERRASGNNSVESPKPHKKEHYKNDLQWEADIWEQLANDIDQATLDVKANAEAEKTATLLSEPSQPWYSIVWSAIKSFLTGIKNFFSGITNFFTSKEEKKFPPYEVELSETEQEELNSLRTAGAERVARSTGMVRVGEVEALSEEGREKSITSRFGMVLASQVVAGTKTENHSILYSVLGSLSSPSDSDATINSIQSAISGVLPEGSPLKGSHACATGGNPEFVTAFESEVFSNLIKNPERYSEFGLHLSDKERDKIALYHQNMERSRDLSNALTAVCYSYGGYEQDEKNHGYKKIASFEEKKADYIAQLKAEGKTKQDADPKVLESLYAQSFEGKQEVQEKKIAVSSKALQDACANLKDGESLYLETGVETHAMQLVISKEGNEFKISTYDSAGALENTTLSQGLGGLIQLSQFRRTEAKRKNAISFTIPQERLISAPGLDYLSGLVRSNTLMGWAETHINNNLSHTSLAERQQMIWPRRLYHEVQARKKYQIYLDHFGSIASPDSPPKFTKVLQHPQNTANCFAKKAQACEFYELGKLTYKKVRLATLLQQKENLLKDIDAGQGRFVSIEYMPMLKSIEPQYLSPAELHEISLRLCEAKSPPSTEYYKKFFGGLLDARKQLEAAPSSDANDLAIARINEKITSHAKSYYQYLKNNDQQNDINNVFPPRFAKEWQDGITPFKTDASGNIDPLALEKISEFAAAQAWKASMQLLNHQIIRLNVNERPINSNDERSPHVSKRKIAKKVTLNDLANANIVNFTTSFRRMEETKIEINVGGKLKEIDKATFFDLVVKNKEGALTNPKIMHLLDYLRNSSHEVEERYMKKVFPAQKQAFIKILEQSITNTLHQQYPQTRYKLAAHGKKIEGMLEKTEENIRTLEQEIKEEQENSNNKSTVKLKNMEARLSVLQQERNELVTLSQSVSTKIRKLEAGITVKGSVANRIDQAHALYTSLKKSDGLTINQINQKFIHAKALMQAAKTEMSDTLRTLEVVETSEQMAERTQQISNYRHKIISNHLQTNDEYHILHELSVGKMGSERNRNRDMYKQTPAQRAEILKQGKNTFLPGSVYQKIQSLNQRLKIQVEETVERKAIINVPTRAKASIESFASANAQYIKMDKEIHDLSKKPIPQAIKDEWVKEMFAIWLEHESPEVQYTISQNTDRVAAVNQAFHHFIEQKANIKYAALKQAGYAIDVNSVQMKEMGWKPITPSEIESIRENRNKAALKILSQFKKLAKNNDSIRIVPSPTPEPVTLISKELSSPHKVLAASEAFVPPDVTFLSQTQREALEGSTLDFLKQRPPRIKGDSPEHYEHYFSDVEIYLQKLKTHPTLENKAQRIIAFSHLTAATLFNSPHKPPESLTTELAKTILDDYRDDERSLLDSFMMLENSERSQLLTSLIKLSLTQISMNEAGKTPVNSKFYSTIKQWEKLIDPTDTDLSKAISMLEPSDTVSQKMDLLKEVDTALHHSPVSLEGIAEGQVGLQTAITNYGKETIIEGVNSDLRQLADRLGMRNGDTLLAKQFINYYSNPGRLLSTTGINSTQGRELFSRAFTDAYRHGTPGEKKELLNFVQTLTIDDETHPETLKTPHQVFIDELLLHCSNQDPQSFAEHSAQQTTEYIPEKATLFIASLTNPEATEGTDRLFGFAKEVNITSLQIENALKSEPLDTEKLDALYSKLICANLAYQLMLDQASEEVIANLNENFEYTKETALVQVNMRQLQGNLIDFCSKLDGSSKLFKTLSSYVQDKKFDGPPILAKSATPSDVPGFISLGGNRTLDAIHGAVYVGNNRLGMMPSYLQSHISVNELKINQLPFRPLAGGYAYSEGNEIKAFIMPKEDGTLIIQRELSSFDGTPQMMQYISPEKMETVPKALRRGLNVEHFFIDSEGSIYGYNADFKPILKLSNQGELWNGISLDSKGNTISINLENTLNAEMIQDLARTFPQSEMINVDKNTIYLPSISKYIISTPEGSYLIMDTLSDTSARRNLKITPEGSAFTERELSESEAKTVIALNAQIKQLKTDLSGITKSDLLSQQNKGKIEGKIKELEASIKEIKEPECFIFVTDSARVKLIEKEFVRTRDEMQQSYLAFRNGAKKDKERLGNHYEQAKEAYLQSKKELQKAYAEISPLRTFDVQGERLEPKDIISALHIGSIPGKAEILTNVLASNTLKSPLKPNELEELKHLRTQYQKKSSLTNEERITRLMLIGTELQHHILQRSEAAAGRLKNWDKKAYEQLKNEFAKEVKEENSLSAQFPLEQFKEVWRAIQSEFVADEELQTIFTITKPTVDVGDKKPININFKTTNMPIETMGARTLVQFSLPDNPKTLIETAQQELEQRLQGLTEFKESVQAQEEGYYYENYGLLNQNTLEKLLSITPQQHGVGGLTKAHATKLFQLMQEQGWIRKVEGMDNKYQLTRHPSEFYSSSKITSALNEMGFTREQSRTISDRLEIFLYQTAVSGGSYSIKEGAKEDLMKMLQKEQQKCNMEFLDAQYKIESTLAQASTPISLTELNAAYLLNDYSNILSYFPEKDRNQIQIVLNNGMTRLLYNKTELDHLNDIQAKFAIGQDQSAIAMLHTRRNYQLDKLLESESFLDANAPAQDLLKRDQEQKMQRAFLLFEAEFGHRCNARQVNIFRGLLLDDVTDPDKIDSAQARMGFGKTTLLPLVALYKTGDKLVRFIVPKSALETNTTDMSKSLANILGRRAVKDDFQRYHIVTDLEANMGEESPRLKSLQDARADLQKRLALYKRVKENREVLVQSPSVRNSLECQAKIFLDMLPKVASEPEHQKELMECISLLNEIRSLETISVFDELDATQDSLTTDVNFTSGEKLNLDINEIVPLELITEVIGKTEDKSVANLAKVLLKQFNIQDDDNSILNYLTSLQVKQPPSVTDENSTEIYLMRAVLTDPIMLSIFTEKEAGTDFGVWFQNEKDGSKLYDFDALKTGEEESKTPLLIAIPYAAANTPKPKGSRFDNPEITAFTTFMYYLDPRTEIESIPHLEFLINSFRNDGGAPAHLLSTSGDSVDPAFIKLFDEIRSLAEIEDPLIRGAEREKYFTQLDARIKSGEVSATAFRKLLARTIIREQVKFDSGKANSNRYEQGTINDDVIGFSGTAGDTSFHFKENMLDPAADGNMTLGIMGRTNCQATIDLDTTSFASKGEDFTTSLIKQLSSSFTTNTRTLIDVGGLYKASNRAVAKEIALQLKENNDPSLKSLKGVIFYDDVTNMKKLLVLDSQNNEKIVDLTPQMVAESDRNGSYFTYYDQSHSRGADIKQMDKAHAVLTLNFTVTNNDYKQAIMRMRKIVDKSLGQSFSTAVPENVREKIFSDLNITEKRALTGNDIAVWLRQKELQNNLNNVSVLMAELDSIIKNAVLQQQAEITKLMPHPMTEENIAEFNELIKELNEISPFISGSSDQLQEKYGKVYGTVKKEEFIQELHESFEKRLTNLITAVNNTRKKMAIPALTTDDKKAYLDIEKRVVTKRQAQLSDEFVIPSASNALAEAQSESESQSESQSQSQSQSQTQTHSFSEVANEEVIVEVQLKKYEGPFKPNTIDYLAQIEKINELPLASQMSGMGHLYNDQDPIRCSPAYDNNKLSTPPIRYFVARETGDPKVILINQDEANLFKKSPVAPWSLYDIRLGNANTITPISGPAIDSLNNPLLKKMYFSAYRHPVTGSDLPALAQSLEDICTPEQLQPSLQIKYQSVKNATAESALFSLPNWGFYGEQAQNLHIKMEQTQDKIKDKFERKGLTISVTDENKEKASVFISAKLNKRILAEVEKQKTGETPPNQPKLKKVMADITREYEAAKEEQSTSRKKIKAIKAEKSKVINDADKVITALQEQRLEAIRVAQEDINRDFTEQMKNLLNHRKTIQNKFSPQWETMCKLKVGDNKEFGIQVFGKMFPNAEKAAAYGVSQLYQEHAKNPMSPEELEKKFDVCINAVFEAVDDRYQKSTNYQAKTKTVMEILHDASKEPTALERARLETMLRREMLDLHSGWRDAKGGTPEQTFKKWNQFVDVVQDITNKTGKNLSQEEFHQKIIEGISQFATDNQMDVEKTLASVMPRLIYSLTPTKPKRELDGFMAGFLNEDPEKLRNIAVTKLELGNYVKRVFSKVTNTPSAEQVELFSALNALSKKKMNSYDYEIAERLLDFQKEPVSREEIKTAVKEVLTKLNIRTVEKEVNSLTDQCIAYLAGRKVIEQNLELGKNGQPTTQLPIIDGKERKLFDKNFERLNKVNTELLEINKKIEEAQAQKKAQVQQLDGQLRVARTEFQQHNAAVAELQSEKTALNKILSGIKNIFSIFTNHQVKLEHSEPIDFLDNHFDLGTLIENEASASATLSFNPPEFYELEADIQVQLERMHGIDELSETESQSQKAFDRAGHLVRQNAETVMERKAQIALQQSKEEQFLTEERVEITPVLETLDTHTLESDVSLSQQETLPIDTQLNESGELILEQSEPQAELTSSEIRPDGSGMPTSVFKEKINQFKEEQPSLVSVLNPASEIIPDASLEKTNVFKEKMNRYKEGELDENQSKASLPG